MDNGFTRMRALGLEPRTYGLKGRCSTSLSYTPAIPELLCVEQFRNCEFFCLSENTTFTTTHLLYIKHASTARI